MTTARFPLHTYHVYSEDRGDYVRITDLDCKELRLELAKAQDSLKETLSVLNHLEYGIRNDLYGPEEDCPEEDCPEEDCPEISLRQEKEMDAEDLEETPDLKRGSCGGCCGGKACK